MTHGPARFHLRARSGILAGLVCAGLLLFSQHAFSPPVEVAAAAPIPVDINATLRYQRVDGFGVNANPKNWNRSNLPQAIDLLTDGLQATIWRVDVYGNSNWIDTPAHLNAAYYAVIYESADFLALWRTLDYLNRKGATIALSASGVLPGWMGGSVLDPAREDDFAEMIGSVVDYGRRVKGLPLRLLQPFNEPDGGAAEGPKMPPDQVVRVLNKVATRLQALGYADVRLVAPEAANPAPEYLSAILADDTLMARVDHLSFHAYTASVGSADSVIRSSRYPNHTFWLGEWSQITTDGYLDNGATVRDEWAFASRMTDDLLQMLQGGAAAALAWDAYDNVHEHCGCTAISQWGLLALNPTTGLYSPKRRYFTNAQVFKFVRSGWVRLGTGHLNPYLHVVAFTDPASSQLTVVGHNVSATALTVQGTMSGMAPLASLHLYETNPLMDLAQLPDVPVTAATFNFDVPADTFFTLTTLGSGPTPTATPVPGSPVPIPTATATPTSTATPTPGPPTRVVTFNELPGVNQPLTGQYPLQVLDWGTNGQWYLSAPWGRFTGKSVSFSGPSITSAPIGVFRPWVLTQLTAYNGGSSPTTLDLSCPGQPPRRRLLAIDELAIVATGWTAYCSPVTVTVGNAWFTNFDDLVLTAAN